MADSEPFPSAEWLDPYGLLRGHVTHLDGRVELLVAGELDLASADALLERIDALARESPGDVYIDLGELEFLGSTGIRALLAAHLSLMAGRRRLVLRNVRGTPLRALALTGALEQLHIEHDQIG